MTDPFVAEIRLFGFNFAPTGWAVCAGQLMPISQNTALFSLIGTFYGGDGKSTFGLPDLQGNVPVNQGQSSVGSQYYLGQQGGVPYVTLLQSEMPMHSHRLTISTSPAVEGQPANQLYAVGNSVGVYGPNSGATVLANPGMVTVTGGNQPHDNMQPYQSLLYCIALQGIYPQRP